MVASRSENFDGITGFGFVYFIIIIFFGEKLDLGFDGFLCERDEEIPFGFLSNQTPSKGV